MEARLSREERSTDRAADANKLHGLWYLLIQLLLQILLGPGEYSEAASELVMRCKKAFSISESSAEDGLEVDTTPEPINVLVLFKPCILSLLEIFLHENPGKPQVLTVYSNLAGVFVNPHTAEISEQLVQCIWGILQKQIFKAKDHPRGDDVQLSTFESLLERNLKLASKPLKRDKAASNPSKQLASWNRQKVVSSFTQNSTYWVLRIIDSRNFSESQLQRVFGIFRDVLAGYFDSKKSQIKYEFLKEIFRRRPWIGHNEFGFLLEKFGSVKSDFRRVEALDLLVEILKSLAAASTKGGDQNASRKIVKTNLSKLSRLKNGNKHA